MTLPGSSLRPSMAIGALAATVANVLLSPAPAQAHEQWFVTNPDSYPLSLADLLRPVVLGGLIAVVVVAAGWRLAAARLPVPESSVLPGASRLSGLIPWVPRLLAAHLGASLLVLAFDRAVLDPGIHVPDGPFGSLLLVPQAVAGALLLGGVLVRAAAVAVVLAGPVVVILHGPSALATLAALLGISIFLILLPPRLAHGGRVELWSDPLRLWQAGLALRVGAATTLISLAVVEKLANPAMARAMLGEVPVLNVLAPVGVGPEGFALFAGLMEVLFGLLLLSAALPQVVALAAAVPFTATLALFGSTELLGHLPVYGVLLTFLLLGSSAETSRVLSSFRPPPPTPPPTGE